MQRTEEHIIQEGERMVNSIRIGFIGCGRHATKMLYPSLHLARIELVAVCDVDEIKAQRNARWFGDERICRSVS